MFTTKKEVIFQMNDNVKKIHEASMQILNKTGMKFYHPDALEILKNHGIKVDGNVAYFTEDQIMEWVRKAPSTAPFTLLIPDLICRSAETGAITDRAAAQLLLWTRMDRPGLPCFRISSN